MTNTEFTIPRSHVRAIKEIGFNIPCNQTWSLMSNMETRTESVDYTQFVGTSYTRTPQIRYDWKIDGLSKCR
jgi:hypothetical protein